MIVECSNCDTRFQLDDSRVPLRGIRVRCSRCKEAFFLEHPDAGKREAIDDVAARAVQGGAPDTTQDLPPGTSVAADGHGDSDEEDWEFNADFPDDDANEASGAGFASRDELPFDGAGEDFSADADEDADAAGSIPGLGVDDMQVDEDDFSSGLDLARADAPRAPAMDDDSSGLDEAAVDEALADLGSSESASDFGEVTDFSALVEERSAPAAPRAPAAAPARAAAPAQELGEPEDWDFFSDDAGEDPSLESMDNAMGRVMEVVEDPSRLKRPSRGPELGSELPERGDSLAGVRSIARAVGWIATCCLFGLGIARGVFDASGQPGRALTSVDLGPLQAQQVRGVWFETARSTHLYAVMGQLVNDSREARMPGTGLRAALRAPDGAPLELAAAPAGALISEAELRELSAADLAWVQQQSVARLAGTRLEPGQSVPFLAFFEAVPDAATGFVLEMDEVPAPQPPQPVYDFAPEDELPDAAAIDEAGAPGLDVGPATTPTSAAPPSLGSPRLPR